MNELADLLNSLGLNQYLEVLNDNDVDLGVLPLLSDEDLRELGFSLGHRRKLQSAIQAVAASPADQQTQPGSPPDAPASADSPATSDPVISSEETSDRSSLSEVAMAERRQLTVMFCDLVGSTALSARLDVEDYRSLLLVYQDICSNAVTRFDGYVARLFGDGMLIYFGFPQAHEDDATRAVHASLLIHQGVSRIAEQLPNATNRQLPDQLQVRIGIATGPVVVGDIVSADATQESTVLGETPNLAARLQSAAGPGQTLIADTTHRLISGRFETVLNGHHQFHGLAGKETVWQVIGEQLTETRTDANQGGHKIPMVGRDEELEILRRRWQLVTEGSGQVVDLFGEAGIGKSRLIRALRETLKDTPHTVFGLQCSSWHSSSALYPVLTRLTRLLGTTNNDSVDQRRGKLADFLGIAHDPDHHSQYRALAELLSIPVAAVPATEENTRLDAGEIVNATLELIEQLASKKPLLLVVEDTQWIDPSSADLIDALANQIRSLPVLMLITHRDESAFGWLGESHVTRLSLNKLSPGISEDLVTSITGAHVLPRALLDEILNKTDGIPLFVEELTKTILESGLVVMDEAGYRLNQPLNTMAIPMTIQDSLMARLDKLSAVKYLAQIGAVIGREFDRELLKIVAALPDDDLEHGLQRLNEAGLLHTRKKSPGISYAFKHAMVQETAYSSLLNSRRLEIHARIAYAVKEHFPAIEENQPEWLANHLTSAGLEHEALIYWKRAAERARSRSTMREALAHIERATSILSSMPKDQYDAQQHFDFLVLKITPTLAVEGYSTSTVEDIYQQAQSLSDSLEATVEFFPLMFARWIRFLNLGDSRQAMKQATQIHKVAVDKKDNTHIALGARLCGIVDVLDSSPQQGCERLEHLIQTVTVEQSRDMGFTYGQDMLVSLHCYLAIGKNILGRFTEAIQHAGAAIERSRVLDHALAKAYAAGHAAFVMIAQGERERLIQCHELLLQAIEQEHMPAWVDVEVGVRGMVCLSDNDYSAAEQHFNAVLQATESIANRIWKTQWHALHARSQLAINDAAGAQKSARAGLEHIENGGGATMLPELLRLQALSHNSDTTNHTQVITGKLRNAIHQAEQQSNYLSLLECSHSLSELLLEDGNNQQALAVLTHALSKFSGPATCPVFTSVEQKYRQLQPGKTN